LLTGSRTRQDQVRHVDTRNQEEKPDSKKQEPEGIGCTSCNPFLEVRHVDPTSKVGIGKLLLQLQCHPIHFLPGCIQSDARKEPAQDQDPGVAASVIDPVLSELFNRDVCIHLIVSRREDESLRHYADNREGKVIEGEGCADYGLVLTELIVPESVR